jgi:hypothetical protein
VTWNYRIVKYADDSGFGLHRVHYDKDGKEIRMAESPAGFTGDTAAELRDALMLARMDARRRPIFDEPPEWAADGGEE